MYWRRLFSAQCSDREMRSWYVCRDRKREHATFFYVGAGKCATDDEPILPASHFVQAPEGVQREGTDCNEAKEGGKKLPEN